MVTTGEDDREAAKRPGRFLTAEWRHLAMLNYEIDATLLRPYVPAGTELDLFEGRCYVSLVGFLFLDTRVFGVPLPRHRDFEEINLRFYVRRLVPTTEAGGEQTVETRRGVVFIKEIVPLRAVATVARIAYGENYIALPMDHEIGDGATPEVTYRWHFDGRDNSLSVTGSGEAEQPRASSEEEFITEHYWGYSSRAFGRTIEYAVEHPPWRVWQAADAQLDCDVAALYGEAFAEPLAGAPSSAFIADGSPVTVFRGQELDH